MAKVLKIDRILALLHFEKGNRFEWIYLGSPRISQIYRLYIKDKKLDNIIDFETYSTCRTSDVIMVDSCEQVDGCEDNTSNGLEPNSNMHQCNGRAARKKHNCSHECVRFEDGLKLENFGLFRRPILCGWERHSRFYRTPCGLCLYSDAEINDYLTETKSKLRIDSFDFSKNIDPTKNCGQAIKISVSFLFMSFVRGFLRT